MRIWRNFGKNLRKTTASSVMELAAVRPAMDLVTRGIQDRVSRPARRTAQVALAQERAKLVKARVGDSRCSSAEAFQASVSLLGPLYPLGLHGTPAASEGHLREIGHCTYGAERCIRPPGRTLR